MKLILKNKFLSPTGKSTIKTEKGVDAYKVKGSFLNPVKTKKLYDLDGNLLYIVKNKFWTFFYHTAFIYNPDKELVCSVKKHQLSASRKYECEEFETPLYMEREFMSLTTTVYKDGKETATIRRPSFFAIVDTFEIETEDEENMPLYLALTLAIDNIGDERRKERN